MDQRIERFGVEVGGAGAQVQARHYNSESEGTVSTTDQATGGRVKKNRYLKTLG